MEKQNGVYIQTPVPLDQIVKKREEKGETSGERITITVNRQLARNIYKRVMKFDGINRETYNIIINKKEIA